MEEQSVVRFYTQARKIPYLLGKIGDFKLPGGPYTLTQGVVAFIVAWIGKATMPMWAGGMITIVAWIPVLLIALACGYIAGRIPFKGRNPLMLLWGLVGYATAPSWGTQAGRPVRMGPSRRIRTLCSTPTPRTYGITAVESDNEWDESPEFEETAGRPTDVREVDRPEKDEKQLIAPEPSHGPTTHQLTEVQQILAASAQRR